MEKAKFLENLINKAKQINVVITEEKANRFYEYNNLLLEWNEKINLTAITEEKDVEIKHFLDSVLPYSEFSKNATVTICHSRTKDLKEKTRNADILVAAIGKPNYVTADMIKEGAVIIDVGINRNEEGKLVGDVDFENVSKKASYITPVPGGVGPMTIAMLMSNVIKATKNQNNF